MASIEKRVRDGQTSWRAHYRTPAGAQRNKTFARKVDAERFLAGVENSKVIGTYVDPALAKVTVGEWAQRWLDGQAHLKPTTRSRYEGILRKHIHPKWDRVKLANVSHGDVQAWVSELAKRHSPATVHKIHRVLSLVLDMAVKDGRLARNVAGGVNLPRARKDEHRYLTHDQVDALAQATGYPTDPSKHSSLDTRTNETYRLVVLFLAYTGVRFGEMAALRVGRLDLRRNRAVIAESVTPVAGPGPGLGHPEDPPAARGADPAVPRRRARATTSQGKAAGRPGLRRHPERPAAAGQHVPHGVQRGGRGDRGARPHPHQLRHTAASLAIAARRRREGRPADARPRLGHHDAGHLRPPLRGPARRGRRRDGRAPGRPPAGVAATPELLPRVAPVLPRPDFGRNDEAAPTSVSAGQDRFSDWYPRPDSNRRYRLERAAC